jgi:predicted permease
MTVPLWSALLSLVVACVDPVKHALEHHMQPLNEAINTSGKCAVPLTLVVLGAYFYTPMPEEEPRKEEKLTFVGRFKACLGLSPRPATCDDRIAMKKEKPGETKTVVLAIASRMIITPILIVPVIVWATKSDWHAVFEECVFISLPSKMKSDWFLLLALSL